MRYLRVYLAAARTCLTRELAYRGHFALLAGSNVAWTVLTLSVVPILFNNVREVAGWDFPRMLLLTGTYQLVLGILMLLFETNMGKLSEYVNKGELDYLLVKPIDSQFLISTRFLTLNQLPATIVALVTVGFAWNRLGLAPGPLQVGGYLVLVLGAILAFYALWFATVTLSIWTGRIENIQFLLIPVMDLARFPSDVFRGLLRPILTFVVPIALISTIPSRALLGALDPALAVYALVFGVVLVWSSQRFWRYSLRRYSSASS